MRLMLLTISIAAALAGLGAQAPPDFSGRWTLDVPAIATTAAVPGTPASAAAPGDMGSGWGSALTIAQDARQLRLEYSPFSRYDIQPPFVFTFLLDGSASRNIVNMGRGDQVEVSQAQWDGASLIIKTSTQVSERGIAKPFTMQVTRKLTLESSSTMIVEVTRSGVPGATPTMTRSIYRKG